MKLISSKHVPWREQLDVAEVEAMSDEYGWDDLLEAVGESEAATSVNRVTTPTPNFRRHTASASSNWDADFSDAQAHARELLSKLG